jgi:hypothetical protein
MAAQHAASHVPARLPGALAVVGSGLLLALAVATVHSPSGLLLQVPPRSVEAAVAQQLAEIGSEQQAVLSAQAKLSGFEPAGQTQALITKDVPFRLSGYSPPGGAPAPSPTVQRTSSSSSGPDRPRLHGFSTGQVPNTGASPWSGSSSASSGQPAGPARLHGYSTGITTGGASPWSGGAAAPVGQPSLGGGWRPHANGPRTAHDFSTKEGRAARRRISLMLEGKRRAHRSALAAQKELRRVIGGRPVEKLQIAVSRAKPVKVCDTLRETGFASSRVCHFLSCLSLSGHLLWPCPRAPVRGNGHRREFCRERVTALLDAGAADRVLAGDPGPFQRPRGRGCQRAAAPGDLQRSIWGRPCAATTRSDGGLLS